MREILLIVKTRFRIANNSVAAIRDHLLVHLFVFLSVIAFLVVGGGVFFGFLFRFLDRQEEFGTLLMNRLVAMVMMAFFSMLVFSNLIITLSTTYISRETDYYMSQPVRHRSIFVVKLIESTFYSSWAFVILSLPFFTSYGIVRGVSPWFYAFIVVLVAPFLVIPAGVGALFTMLLCAFLPARRTLKWVIVLLGLAIVGGTVFIRTSGVQSRLFRGEIESYTELLNLLKVGAVLWAPHYWMSRGMLALGKGDWKEFAYWLAMISSTALMLIQVCLWLAPSLYYRGWCLAHDSGRSHSSKTSLGPRVFGAIERALGFIRPPVRALLMKDIRTFWRDPAHWSQLVILFGLLVIYVANLRGAHLPRRSVYIILPFWKTLLSFFNMGATCFILSILTTRFVYPMLSLEGKQFWVVGLAPMNRSSVVWQKYWLCWTSSFVLAESLMLFSNWILSASAFLTALSSLSILVMSFGLTSLAVGLGAATPNFKEDNPARIANGLGGTLNVILSLLYIGATMAVLVYPAFLIATGGIADYPEPARLLGTSAFFLFVLQAVTIVVPMAVGLRLWKKMEF
ncbi:hypothetical protein JW916_10445 [Candidatus Sumerlaeota bacterium]|nr:hypothetical protein [Candidatus Sumerlaeota bacterium]